MATSCNSASSGPSNLNRTVGERPSSSSQEEGSTDGSWHDAPDNPPPRHAVQAASAGPALGAQGVVSSLAPSGYFPGGSTIDGRASGLSRSVTPRPDVGYLPSGNRATDIDEAITSEARQAAIRAQIEKELKIKTGTENMLEALLSKNLKQTKAQRQRVESELNSSNRKIEQLRRELQEEILRSQASEPSRLGYLSTLFGRDSSSRLGFRSTDQVEEDDESETESPTYVLAETMQALDVGGMQPDYYVEKANNLVELFKRHPTLKYDLEWSGFGLCVQRMLLSDSREVVAAGYRLTRYAIADRRSIRIIRSLHTDEVVILSLVKESKESMEREQALKFVRAFLDVKDGVREISRAVVRTIVAIADHREDLLRNICIMTLAEILVKDPGLLYYSGGIGVINEALAEGTFNAADSLAAGFVHVLDSPQTRKYLRFGRELDAVFACFTERFSDSERKTKLQPAAKAISTILKTWPGLLVLSQDNAQPIRSLLQSLQYPDAKLRDLILELLYDVLRIKTPSWSSSYLAGRRLTTYGRVTQLRSEQEVKQLQALYQQKNSDLDLTVHFSALLLATLINAGLIQALSDLAGDEGDLMLKRKATLLLTEVLKRAHHTLPQSICAQLQVLPNLIPPDIGKMTERSHISTATIYQIDSINRTMNRTDGIIARKGQPTLHPDSNLLNPSTAEATASSLATTAGSTGNAEQGKLVASMDEAQFRQAIMDTNVLSSANFNKWNWDLIHNIIESPLTNTKRLDEAIKGSKFMKRLMGFYRPFKYRFSGLRNTKANERYVRTGCALFRTLVQSPEGSKYLSENKVLRQIAECLAQVDRMSGLTSESPVFSRRSMTDTVSWGYFSMLGTLSSEPTGLQMMERWHMHNMFYHIVELKDRNDLVLTLLGNMDYKLEGHLRIILSKALTTGTKDIRIFATSLLRKYAVNRTKSGAPVNWVIKLLVTQLYDPDVSVCQVAVKLLEEACIEMDCLEYVVRCRPSLDHLGEIGAPLLLRFLSTSVGYHYLDELDYITQEMDDWFLGRNDAYVGLVEATLSRAYVEQPRRESFQVEDLIDLQSGGLLPPHFYRELARTQEGCRLLQQSGHFEEFAHTIRHFNLDEEDPEVLLKVKGALWAVGNLGSMELSAEFLESTEIVQRIVKIAEHASVLSMRGTAFFVLGLISRSQHGLEMLFEAGWVAAVDHRGYSTGSCLPADLKKLSSIPRTPFSVTLGAKEQKGILFRAVDTEPDPLNKKILNSMMDLVNTVLTKRAATDLHGMKLKHPECFRQTQLYRKALLVLESHNIRLFARRFVLNLFDKDVLRQIVLGEEESESEDESESDAESMTSE